MKSILLIIILAVYGCAVGQKVTTVPKVYAFSKKVMPGNVATDENGNQMGGRGTIQHFIVLETKSGAVPVWKTATINGQLFKLNPFAIETASINVGTQKSSGKPIIITTSKGNKLWQIELEPQGANSNQNNDRLINQVVLYGTVANKKVTYKIDREVELASFPAY